MSDKKQKLLDAILHQEQALEKLYIELEDLDSTTSASIETTSDDNIAAWQYNFENEILYWSPKLYEIFEIDKNHDGSLYDFYVSCFNENDFQLLENGIESLYHGAKNYYFKHAIQLPNNKQKKLECSGYPMFNENDKIIGVKGIVREINSKNAKKRPESRLNQFFKASVDLQCIANEKGHFIEISPSWEVLLGYSKEEICSKPFLEFVHPSDYQKTIEEMNRMLDGEKSLSFENRYITKSDEVVDLSWNATIDPYTKLIYCTARNITQEKAEKKKLLSNLTEKELLLKEIHHRVKNNLQIISSLLSLQANMEEKKLPRLKKLYVESQGRINSMAAIHEMFYQSETLKQIDFNKYINKLIVDVIHTFQGNIRSIKSTIDIENIFLNLDTAIPLGLIANEIISNSFKHAFNGSGKGEIKVSMKEHNNDSLVFTIGDDGCGFQLDPKDGTETLGRTIIESLVEQLEGKIQLKSNSNGTTYIIHFKRQH